MGNEDRCLQHVDLSVVREGPQLSYNQRKNLIAPIQEKEIYEALHDVGDSKAPGVDGYSAKLFKTCWNIVKQDLVKAICYWFKHNTMYKAFNGTLVTLHPKSADAKYLKD
ncbi:unnamed protein product [Vicia faba]|uniref:Reverse transcriptase n=1 Tax=Vicia faba TaxID=3906 RepID=A0AAV0ZUB7_VICFA|nr:unnamed protein product [Vicia faba]